MNNTLKIPLSCLSLSLFWSLIKCKQISAIMYSPLYNDYLWNTEEHDHQVVFMAALVYFKGWNGKNTEKHFEIHV